MGRNLKSGGSVYKIRKQEIQEVILPGFLLSRLG
jgi:hypothetical protein